MKSWLRFPYRRVEPGFFGALGLALICVGVAAVVRLVLGLIGSTLYFAPFFPAVLICALIGGRLAGLLSIALSIFAVWWLFVPPGFAFSPLSSVDIANFILFALSGLLVVALSVNHRNNVFALQDREQQRELLVNELEHRSKNMFAVVTSLVQQTIRDRELADTLINRIRVAADNQDLLANPHDNASQLRDLLQAMREPYGERRITLDGPDIRLNGREARSLRIVFHEMATNAVKYGALSNTDGRITVTWSVEGDKVVLLWQESGGPKVAPPAKLNFGSKLIAVTLNQMKAECGTDFAETGYCYRIGFPLD